MKFLRRILYLLNRRSAERDLTDELAAHREMLLDDRRTSFGNALKLREESRDAWGFTWLDQLRQDLGYALRSLWRSKGFTLAATGVLALGIGANLAEFHIFDVILFHRVNVRDSATLLRLTRQAKGRFAPFSIAAAKFYRDHSSLLEYAVTENTGVSLRGDDGSAVRGAMVSSNYFPSLNVHPSYGRLIVDADGNPGAPPVAALGYGYWQTRYGSDPGIVGQTVRMNGKPVQIVGVLPFDFDGLSPHNTAVWLPETTRPYLIPGSPSVEDFGASDTDLFAKPKTGVSANAVQAQLLVLTNELHAQQPQHVMEGESIRLDPLQAMPSLGQVPAPVILFLVLTLLVLLSACANLGSVLLARGVVRERELQIRMAVGAGRWRLMRQLMTENVLLAALGCIAGLALGYAAAKALIYLLDAPPDIRIRMDWRIISEGGILALVSSLSFGLAPAMHAVRRGHKTTRARQVLIAIQVAVGCMLLIISATIVRNVQEGAAINVPFDYTHMVLVDPHPFFSCERCAPAGGFRLAEMEALLEKMPQLQGITSATIPPLGYRQNLAHVPGLPSIFLNSVEPSYFEVMNLPIVRGRTFRPFDQKTVVVGESAARAAWPNEDPIGKSLDLGRLGQVTVIGVVKDSGANLYADPTSVEAYLPLDPAQAANAIIIVHAAGNPVTTLKNARSALDLPGQAATAALMQAQVNERIDSQRRTLMIVGALGATATFLAAVGIFGLVAFAVAQRTRELGIRKALGAPRSHIIQALTLQYMKPIGAGAIVGLIVAAAIGKVLPNQVNGVTNDPVAYLAGLGVFAAILILAMLAPARRALKIDAASALRWE